MKYENFSKENIYTDQVTLNFTGARHEYSRPPVQNKIGTFSSAKDIIPTEDDFVLVKYRLLSATTVGAGSWKATDFSNARMLKKSMQKLVGKPVFTDHNVSSDNWVGTVSKVEWSGPKTLKNGDKIPSGIDGTLKLDAKARPAIVRGVLAGAINSNSVTVQFNWQPSHDDYDSFESFYDALGTTHEDGTMVRKVSTEIQDYHETSLLWLGADPYAKKLNDKGTPTNVDKANAYEAPVNAESFTSTQNKYIITEAYNTPFGNSNYFSNSKNDVMNEIIEALAKKGYDVNEGNLIELINSLPSKEDNESHLTVLTDFSRLDTATKAIFGDHKCETWTENFSIITKEQHDIYKENEAWAETGKSHLTKIREEAKTLYKLAAGDEASEHILNIIGKANIEAASAFINQYTKEATTKFGGRCKECGSNEFEFRSSVEVGTDTEILKNPVIDRVSNTETFEDFLRNFK